MARADSSAPDAADSLLSRNAEAIASLHANAERRAGAHQRRIESLAAAVGRPASVYIVAATVFAWVVANSVAPRVGLRPLDAPPFAWLQGALTLCSVLLTTTVLVAQNRQSRLVERRAQLDLQVNLLAEQKSAKVIALLEELRRDLPSVRDRHDAEAEAMKSAIDPHAVLEAFDDALATKQRDAPPTNEPSLEPRRPQRS